MKSFFIKTYGCQMNRSDSEKISGLLKLKGLQKSLNYKNADIVVFNTCCVRESAENKLYGNLKALKNSNGNKTIVVAGCLAQREREKLLTDYKADVVLGPQNIEQLPQLLEQKPVASFRNQISVFHTDLPEIRDKSFSAWLPIVTGCNNFCSYCAVPYVRGREKSIPLEKICRAAQEAASDGVVELTLLGQNVNSYGRDLYGKPKFAKLLKMLAQIKYLRRIRFVTSHPKDLDDQVIKAVAENDNICKHIHLPVQAGSNAVLKAMKRGYTKEQYLALTNKLRNGIPSVSISTDIMVGFPGETENDFNDTLDVVEKASFDSAFTFIYSPRPGTKAYPMKELSKEVLSKRFNKLTELVQIKALESNKKFEGKKVEVLVEGKSKKNPSLYTGRTDCNRIVHFPASAKLNCGLLVRVLIKSASSWYLTGRMVE